MVRVGLIGAGYMGSAHARVIRRIGDEYPGLVELSYVVDPVFDKAKALAKRYGGHPVKSVKEISGEGMDFAIIASPTRTHLDVFMSLVERGVGGVLVEKPMASSLGESVEFVRVAREYGVWVAVGHIERFNPAVIYLHRLVVGGRIGDLLTFTAKRVGPFAPRAGDTDVVYDLGVHEVDNVLSLVVGLPSTVRAYTLSEIVTDLNDYALMVLGFGSGFASIEVNRLTPFKQRVLYLTGTRGVVFLDYMGQELRFFTPSEETVFRIRKEEPLYIEDLVVIKSFAEKRLPPIDVYQGFTTMLVCGAALESAKRKHDIVLEEYKVYRDYRDYIDRAIEGYRRYRNMVQDWLWKILAQPT